MSWSPVGARTCALTVPFCGGSLVTAAGKAEH